jgi:hypothetical protein
MRRSLSIHKSQQSGYLAAAALSRPSPQPTPSRRDRDFCSHVRVLSDVISFVEPTMSCPNPDDAMVADRQTADWLGDKCHGYLPMS